MRLISKRFSGIPALEGVDFQLRRGEVHALLGENGAGKTTLMNILTGLYRLDEGTITVNGKRVEIRSPRDALEHRIGMVHQHFELVHAFSALDNIVLAAERSRLRLNRDEHRRRSEKLMHDFGFDIDLDQRVRDLAVGQQQKVEILRMLYAGVEVLILDEPTTHLTPMEVDSLSRALRQLAESGLGVVLVNHKLKEVMAVSDRISVLRKGRNVGTVTSAEASEDILVEMVMGKSIPTSMPVLGIHGAVEAAAVRLQETPSGSSAEVLLEVVGVANEGPLPIDVSLEVRRGEILGIAGVAGNGQMQLLETLVGIRPATAGSLRLGGRELTRLRPSERIKLGLAVLPADRLKEGILPGASIFESYALGQHHLFSDWRWRKSTLREAARRMIESYNVLTPTERTVTAALSGGNIQKLLVARAMEIASHSASGLLLAMNPTRGLDVGATAFVHEEMRKLANAGQGALLISEDLEELFLLADRIYVLHAGRTTGEYTREEFDAYTVGYAMVGGAA